MKTAWQPSIGNRTEAPKSPEGCPRCGREGHREHLMQTTGVGFYRCGVCGHLFIVRSTPPSQVRPA